jgi:hypothetical protein
MSPRWKFPGKPEVYTRSQAGFARYHKLFRISSLGKLLPGIWLDISLKKPTAATNRQKQLSIYFSCASYAPHTSPNPSESPP